MQRLWVANAYFSIRFQAAELLRTEFLRSTAQRPVSGKPAFWLVEFVKFPVGF